MAYSCSPRGLTLDQIVTPPKRGHAVSDPKIHFRHPGDTFFARVATSVHPPPLVHAVTRVRGFDIYFLRFLI